MLRNTYGLLSLTLVFSAATAAASAAFALPHPGLLLTLAGFFGLLFLTSKLRDSGWGVLSVFGLTGFMGYTLGPILGQHLALPNGHQVVMMAMGGTAAIFVALSAYALVTPQGLQLHGRVPAGRHRRGLPGRSGRTVHRRAGAFAHACPRPSCC